MIDERLIIEKLDLYKDGIQKLNKPYMKKYLSPNQFCYLMDRLIEYIETNKECEHEWASCGLTTIRNPTGTKSSLPNGQYKYCECTKCKKHKLEPLEECEHNWEFVQELFNCDNAQIIKKYVCKNCGEIEFRI